MSPAPNSTAVMRAATIEDEFKNWPELKVEHLKTLREWLKMQPHLPNSNKVSEMWLLLFLRACDGSIERAKTTIDNFFTFRTHVPEMSIRRTTDRPDMQICFNTIEMVPLAHRDPHGNMIMMMRLRDTDPSKYDPVVAMKTILTVLEAHLYEKGSIPGGILVFDQKGYGLSHLVKVHIGVAKKTFYYLQECAAVHIKRIHIVNANQYIEKILMFFKAFMNKQVADSIVVHTEGSLEKLYQEIPRDILPSDYGGKGKSLAELHDEVVARLPQFNHVFTETDKLVVDESKRPDKTKGFQTTFGMEGSFKKLNID